jgi:hypothetical protein
VTPHSADTREPPGRRESLRTPAPPLPQSRQRTRSLAASAATSQPPKRERRRNTRAVVPRRRKAVERLFGASFTYAQHGERCSVSVGSRILRGAGCVPAAGGGWADARAPRPASRLWRRRRSWLRASGLLRPRSPRNRRGGPCQRGSDRSPRRGYILIAGAICRSSGHSVSSMKRFGTFTIALIRRCSRYRYGSSCRAQGVPAARVARAAGVTSPSASASRCVRSPPVIRQRRGGAEGRLFGRGRGS